MRQARLTLCHRQGRAGSHAFGGVSWRWSCSPLPEIPRWPHARSPGAPPGADRVEDLLEDAEAQQARPGLAGAVSNYATFRDKSI